MFLSLPSRERGLKSMVKVMLQSMLLVAPFAGAWIEINFFNEYNKRIEESLPSRERGLKYKDSDTLEPYLGSLPSRERGLK